MECRVAWHESKAYDRFWQPPLWNFASRAASHLATHLRVPAATDEPVTRTRRAVQDEAGRDRLAGHTRGCLCTRCATSLTTSVHTATRIRARAPGQHGTRHRPAAHLRACMRTLGGVAGPRRAPYVPLVPRGERTYNVARQLFELSIHVSDGMIHFPAYSACEVK